MAESLNACDTVVRPKPLRPANRVTSRRLRAIASRNAARNRPATAGSKLLTNGSPIARALGAFDMIHLRPFEH